MPESEGENQAQKDCATILVVEDCEEDVFLFRRAFNSVGLHPFISHARDGDEAIKYLSRQAVLPKNSVEATWRIEPQGLLKDSPLRDNSTPILPHRRGRLDEPTPAGRDRMPPGGEP